MPHRGLLPVGQPAGLHAAAPGMVLGELGRSRERRGEPGVVLDSLFLIIIFLQEGKSGKVSILFFLFVVETRKKKKRKNEKKKREKKTLSLLPLPTLHNPSCHPGTSR